MANTVGYLNVAIIMSCKIPGLHYEKDIGKTGEIVHRTETAVWLKTIGADHPNKNYWVYHDDWEYAHPMNYTKNQIGQL